MTTIVIPVRPGNNNPELRYTLRSIHTHVPNPDVWIVGHLPHWVRGVHYLRTQPTGPKPDRGCQQARAAAHHPDTPNQFWWWDDDMYRLTPLHAPEIRHGGPLTDWLNRYQHIDSTYAHTIRRTAARLTPDALMYDLHIPMWIRDRHELATTMDLLPDGTGGWLWRTIHGNRLNYGGTGHHDVKLYANDPIPTSPGQWISSDNQAFPRLRTELLHPRHPDPSPWEHEPEPTTYRRGPNLRRLTPTTRQHDHLIRAGWQPV